MSREGLAPAVEESVAILNASLQQDRDNSTLVKTLQVLKCFLAKLERIDREARQAAGQYDIHTHHLTHPMHTEEREEEVGTAPRELLTTSERKMMFHEVRKPQPSPGSSLSTASSSVSGKWRVGKENRLLSRKPEPLFSMSCYPVFSESHDNHVSEHTHHMIWFQGRLDPVSHATTP